jgi:hypothetical protein
MSPIRLGLSETCLTSPSFLELGSSALAESEQVFDQGVRGAGFDVEGLLGFAPGAANRGMYADVGADVALVRECRQAVGGGLAQSGHDVDAGGGDVGCGAGLDIGDWQGVPSGDTRNCTSSPNALCFWVNHRAFPLSRSPSRRSDSMSVPSRITCVVPSCQQRFGTSCTA